MDLNDNMNPDVRVVLANAAKRHPGLEIAQLRVEYGWERDAFVAENLGTGADLRAAVETLRADRYARKGETEAERAAGFYLAARDVLFARRVERGDFAREGWR